MVRTCRTPLLKPATVRSVTGQRPGRDSALLDEGGQDAGEHPGHGLARIVDLSTQRELGRLSQSVELSWCGKAVRYQVRGLADSGQGVGTWFGERDIGRCEGEEPGRGYWGALRARFDTGSFGAGAGFVAAVGRLAGATGHSPDVDVRAGHVQFAVRSHDVGAVTERDVHLAERISALASDQGLVPRPEQVQVLELALDTPTSDTVPPFWEAVLGGAEAGSDVADRRIAAAVAAGGRVVDDGHAPAFVVLADPDDNHACICTELGRDCPRPHRRRDHRRCRSRHPPVFRRTLRGPGHHHLGRHPREGAVLKADRTHRL